MVGSERCALEPIPEQPREALLTDRRREMPRPGAAAALAGRRPPPRVRRRDGDPPRARRHPGAAAALPPRGLPGDRHDDDEPQRDRDRRPGPQPNSTRTVCTPSATAISTTLGSGRASMSTAALLSSLALNRPLRAVWRIWRVIRRRKGRRTRR